MASVDSWLLFHFDPSRPDRLQLKRYLSIIASLQRHSRNSYHRCGTSLHAVYGEYSLSVSPLVALIGKAASVYNVFDQLFDFALYRVASFSICLTSTPRTVITISVESIRSVRRHREKNAACFLP